MEQCRRGAGLVDAVEWRHYCDPLQAKERPILGIDLQLAPHSKVNTSVKINVRFSSVPTFLELGLYPSKSAGVPQGR